MVFCAQMGPAYGIPEFSKERSEEMKTIDSSNEGIFEISWSPDGQWIAYVRGEDEICIANPTTDEIRVIGPGAYPGFTANNQVIFERNDEIHLADGGGSKTIVSRGDLVSDTPKRAPFVSMDGTRVVFSVNNVFHKDSQNKNAYAYRHFIGLIDLGKGTRAKLTTEQWYGGVGAWFPSGTHFTHFEYDSTGGARLHIVNKDGVAEGTMFGLFPSISPDEKRIACKPKTGQNVVVYTQKGTSWDRQDVEAAVYRLPESNGRLSGSPPQWLDNRYVLVDEGGKLFRVDTRKEAATEMKKLPLPTLRGKQSMTVSPSREFIAIETQVEDKYELRVLPLP